MWSVVDWSSGTWSDSDTWSEGVIDTRDRLPSNLWTSEKMRVIAQLVGEFQGCFLPTEECRGGFCPKPWWRTCSSLSRPLLFLFQSMLPSPGLLTIPTQTDCQPLSCLSFAQPPLLVLVQPLQHHRGQSQGAYFSHSLCSSFPCSPFKAPSSQMLSPWPPIFVLLLVCSAFEVGTSFSKQPGQQAGGCQKARRHRHHSLCTESHTGQQQQEGLVWEVKHAQTRWDPRRM